MNQRLIIILCAFAFLMTAYDYYHRHAARMAQKSTVDPLVHAIEEHNAKKKSGFSSLGDMMNPNRPVAPVNPGNPYPTVMAPALPPLDSAINRANPAYPAAPANPAAPAQNSFYPPPAGNAAAPAVPSLQAPAQGQPYYPPAYNNQAPQPNVVPPGAFDQPSMPGGPHVEFSGDDVYTYDIRGRRVPLADGNYPIYGGQVIMTVRDGKKVTANN